MVEHLTLDFSSGCDPRVMGSSPALGSVLSVGPAWDFPPLSVSVSVSLPLSAPPLLTCALSKIKKNNKNYILYLLYNQEGNNIFRIKKTNKVVTHNLIILTGK